MGVHFNTISSFNLPCMILLTERKSAATELKVRGRAGRFAARGVGLRSMRYFGGLDPRILCLKAEWPCMAWPWGAELCRKDMHVSGHGPALSLALQPPLADWLQASWPTRPGASPWTPWTGSRPGGWSPWTGSRPGGWSLTSLPISMWQQGKQQGKARQGKARNYSADKDPVWL